MHTMPWVNEHSSPSELRLDNAWDALNMILDRRVPLAVQMRLTACVHDALCHATLLRELERNEIDRANALHVAREEWAAGDPRKGPPPHWDSHYSFQFAAALKATFYFIRSLHDAVYSALLDGTGGNSGRYSSMHDCARNARNPLHPHIEKALPGYFEWFAGCRNLRNEMKVGVSTSFHFRGLGASTKVAAVLPVIDSVKREVSGGREVSLLDVDRAFDESSRLLEWTAAYLASTA